MDVITTRKFGLLIAYVIPGFVCLLGAGTLSEAVWVWLVGAGVGGPSVGGVCYVGIASIGAGMTASVVRWAVLDTAHHFTGLQRPSLDESRLTERLEAFDYLVEQHYRYYQFYGNSLIAVAAFYGMWRVSPHAAGVDVGWLDFVPLFVGVVFTAGSRDALRKYYDGGTLLLGTMQKETERDERQAPSLKPVQVAAEVGIADLESHKAVDDPSRDVGKHPEDEDAEDGVVKKQRPGRERRGDPRRSPSLKSGCAQSRRA